MPTVWLQEEPPNRHREIPGMSASSLRAFAQEHGLSEPQTESDVQFLADRRGFGRWRCRVEIKNGVVTQVELNGAN